MATTKSAKIEAEIEKVKAKIAEQQTKLKELEQRKVEAENSEIVDIVRGMSIPLAELPLVLQQLRAGKTLGQNVPNMGNPAKSADFVGRGGTADRVSNRPEPVANDTEFVPTKEVAAE